MNTENRLTGWEILALATEPKVPPILANAFDS